MNKEIIYDYTVSTFRVPKVVIDALQEIADEDAVKLPVVIRKAMVTYAKKKGKLNEKERYL